MSEEHDEQPFGGTVPPISDFTPMSDSSRAAEAQHSEKPHVDAKKGIFERTLPVIIKRVIERAVESGVEKLSELSERPESLRHFVSELRLPKEVLADVYAQIDDTKNGLYRVVAKEIRDVLEHTQIAEEIAKALTKLSFEIKTEIRFVPNDRAKDADETDPKMTDSDAPVGLRPKVTTEVTVKDRLGEKRPR